MSGYKYRFVKKYPPILNLIFIDYQRKSLYYVNIFYKSILQNKLVKKGWELWGLLKR